MKNLLLILILAVSTNFQLMSQLQVYSGNNVGIGTTSANSKLSVHEPGNSVYGASFSTPSTGTYSAAIYARTNQAIGYGIVCYPYFPDASGIALRSIYSVASKSSGSSNNGYAFAVHGVAGNAQDGYNAGILGVLQGTRKGAGVYGQSGTTYSAPDAQYAGYFYGNAKITGTLTVNTTVYTSDARLKRDISAIDSIDKFFSLNPVKYYFKGISEQNSILNTNNQSDTTSSNNEAQENPDYIQKAHFGLLAQELAEVYPDLVYQSGNGSYGIDYIGLIPLIIEQIKIMKETMDLKDQKIIELEKRLQQLELNSKVH